MSDSNDTRISVQSSPSMRWLLIDWCIHDILYVIGLFIRGVILCIDGISYSVGHKSTVNKSYKFMVYTLLFCTVIYIALLVSLYLPCQLVLYIASKYIHHYIYGFLVTNITPYYIFQHVFYALPIIIIFLLSNLYMYEQVFLNTIKELDPSLHNTIISNKRKSFTQTLFHSIKRNLKLVLIGGAISVVRIIPIAGKYFPAIWSIRYCYSLYKLHIKRMELSSTDNTLSQLTNSTKTKFILCVLGLYMTLVTGNKHAANVALLFLTCELSCRNLVLELFDGLFSRMNCDGSELRYELDSDESISKSSSKQFMIRYHWELLGFAAPLILCSYIPIFGIFILVMAHAAAGYALVKIHKRNNLIKT